MNGEPFVMTPAQSNPIAAIAFALTIDDHYDLREFLTAWQHGNTSEWPEYTGAEGERESSFKSPDIGSEFPDDSGAIEHVLPPAPKLVSSVGRGGDVGGAWHDCECNDCKLRRALG